MPPCPSPLTRVPAKAYPGAFFSTVKMAEKIDLIEEVIGRMIDNCSDRFIAHVVCQFGRASSGLENRQIVWENYVEFLPKAISGKPPNFKFQEHRTQFRELGKAMLKEALGKGAEDIESNPNMRQSCRQVCDEFEKSPVPEFVKARQPPDSPPRAADSSGHSFDHWAFECLSAIANKY